jgi:hypothetical protein
LDTLCEIGHAPSTRGPSVRAIVLESAQRVNGDQMNRITALALKRGKSVDFTGYWQRNIAD